MLPWLLYLCLSKYNPLLAVRTVTYLEVLGLPQADMKEHTAVRAVGSRPQHHSRVQDVCGNSHMETLVPVDSSHPPSEFELTQKLLG